MARKRYNEEFVLDENIYENFEELLDEDEISPEEEGFMKGYMKDWEEE